MAYRYNFLKQKNKQKTKKRKVSFIEWLELKGYLSQWHTFNELQKEAIELEYKGY